MSSRRLGFGTASLAAVDDRRAAWKLLDAALESGILHFDTARLYGDGTMERIISPFVKANREQITITTKFGLAGRWKGYWPALVLPVARRCAKAILGGRPPGQPSPAASFQQPVPVLDVALMKRSLETSLRELGIDCVDTFLMHEARPSQIRGDLLQALEREKEAGKIASYGNGGEWATAMAPLGMEWPSVPVRQASVSLALADREPAHLTDRPDVIHSVLRGAAFLDREVVREGYGRDFPHEEFVPGSTFPTLFLQWALLHYPESRILVASRSIETIRANARLADNLPSPSLLMKRIDWMRRHRLISTPSL